MKQLLSVLSLSLVGAAAQAQTLRVHNAGDTLFTGAISTVDSIKLDNTYSKFKITGNTGTINIQKALMDSITFSNNAAAQTKIFIIFNGSDDVTIINPYAAQGVAITATGTTVTVTSTATLSNLEYNLLGTSTAGSITMSSAKPATFVLNNLNLTNAAGPAINVTGGQVHTFIAKAGTTSSLTDGATNTKNGTLQTDAKLILAGTGNLTIKGVKKHGISTTGAIEVQSSNITITGAASDALHSEGYVMSGGSVTVAAATADGIDAGDGAVSITSGTINITSTSVDVKALKTGNNTITISGGNLTLNVSGNASKAISAKGNITLNGGTYNITLSGAQTLTASGSGFDASYCTGIKTDGQILIGGGNYTIQTTAAAGGGKGFSSTGAITVSNGTFNVTTAGGNAAYVNTNGVASSYSTTGFSTDAAINISGGNFTMVNTGTEGKAFSSDGPISVTGGTINVTNNGHAGKGFKADGNVTFAGGTTTINLNGTTAITTANSVSSSSYPTGVKAGGSILMNSGTVSVTGSATAKGARGFSATNGIIINDGSVTANLSGADSAFTVSTGVIDTFSCAGLSCDADITLAGGTLTLTNSGRYGKNVKSDANILVNGGTINLTNSGGAGKGYSANSNVTINGGTSTVNISGPTVLTAKGSGNDPSYPAGVKADKVITVNGGSITVTGTSAATGARGLSADTAINVLNGTVNVNLAGNGANYTATTGLSDSYAAAALSSDKAITISGGSVTTTCSGTGGKGLKSDGTIVIDSVANNPTVTITTTGARFLQTGSDYNHPKTIVATGAIAIRKGNLVINSTDDGIHSDASVTISGGYHKISAISATQGVGEGIEAPIINFTGGVTDVTASNDAINGTYGTVSGGTESNDGSQINISGGILIATGSDAIDANGNLTITGGTTIVCGPSSQPEEGIDYNGTFNMNGGFLIAAGSNANMTKAMSSTSTQTSMYLKSSAVLATSSMIHIENASGTEMVTFKPRSAPNAYNGVYYFHFSSPSLLQGNQYKVYFGGTHSGSFVGSSNGWGLYQNGTWTNTGATLKTTVTTSSSAKVTTATF